MQEAFANCTNLSGVRFPAQLNFLGTEAFDRCKRLESVRFEKDSQLKRIDGGAFSECRYLHDLVLPDGLETIEKEAFYKCDNLQRIQLPETLKYIGNSAFYQCSMREIELPRGLERIGDSAFLKCKQLQYVKIPTSVKYLGKWAFHGCNQLQVLEIEHDPEVIGEWITNKNCTIRCKEDSRMAAYARANNLHLEYI